MSLGTKISAARQAKKLTQAKLAEQLDVSTEAVSKWEQDKYVPTADKQDMLEEVLSLSLYEDYGTPRNVRLFDEVHMSAYLKGRLDQEHFPEASAALSYAKEKHAGQFRKPEEARIPYIIHPFTMACHALAMGLEEDALLAALLLHDVSEDCHVEPEDLPFSPEVQSIVARVSKPPKPCSDALYSPGTSANADADTASIAIASMSARIFFILFPPFYSEYLSIHCNVNYSKPRSRSCSKYLL